MRQFEERYAPVGTDSVTVDDDEVTTLPAESSILRTGSVVNAVPAVPATGGVVKTSWAGTPGPVTSIGLEIESDPSVAVNVYGVLTRPAKVHDWMLTTPLTDCWSVQLARLGVLVLVVLNCNVSVDAVTIQPCWSKMSMVGWTSSA